MEVRAILRYARVTPRKMRLVARLCQGMPVDKAAVQLRFCQKRGAKMVHTLLNSAVANARDKGGLAMDSLVVKSVMVDDGPVMKRFMPRSQGRAYPILKKMCHVTLILDEAR
jgi:large subunit ribosomal protein L22